MNTKSEVPDDSGLLDPLFELNRWEIAKMQTQYVRLRDNPEARAERVAKHYAAHANLAAEMLKAVELRKRRPANELDSLIEHHMRVITENHRNELGIPLDWPNSGPKNAG